MEKKGKGKVMAIVFRKRNRLLNMEYTTGEIADELGVTPKYIRQTMIAKFGAPYSSKDKKTGRIMINGAQFRKWIETQFASKPKKKQFTSENEFYCVNCKDLRKSDNYVLVTNYGMIYKKAYCPICGCRMNRIVGKESKND